MTSFENPPISPSEIPELRDSDFVPVDPNYVRVSLVVAALLAAAVAIAGVVVSVVVATRQWIPLVVAAGLLLLIGLGAVARVIEVRRIAYQVRDKDLSYRSGVFVRSVSTIPFVRVQHARISSGPVERRFGLATLEVNSAGPDLHIRGLAKADADRLKDLVVERAGDLDEES